jgi:hypothetical protein
MEPSTLIVKAINIQPQTLNVVVLQGMDQVMLEAVEMAFLVYNFSRIQDFANDTPLAKCQPVLILLFFTMQRWMDGIIGQWTGGMTMLWK